jgi:plasmid stabilization system protein ParE
MYLVSNKGLSKAALTGLDQIVEFIHTDNPIAAERFGNALLNHVDLLSAFPHIDQPVARRPGIP